MFKSTVVNVWDSLSQSCSIYKLSLLNSSWFGGIKVWKTSALALLLPALVGFLRQRAVSTSGIVVTWYIQCVQKKETRMFFVVSSTKLGRFWWNLVQRFLTKFAAKWCKHFPPHLNNASTLPCETWNVYHAGATTALSEKETPEIIPSQLWPPNSPDLNLVDYSTWEYCKRRCTKHASRIWMNWNSDWERRGPSWICCRHCGSHSSVASLITADHWSVFCTPFLQYFPHAVIN